MIEVAQIGGDRTAMLALLDRVRALVVSGEADGVMVLWGTDAGVDSDVEGVWWSAELILELSALHNAQSYLRDLAVDARLSELGG